MLKISATIDELIRYWYEKTGLVIAIILTIIAEVPVLVSSKATILISAIIILSSALTIYIFWKLSRKLPKTPKGKVGFVVSIASSTEEEKTTIQEDFVIPLRQLIKSGKTGKAFHFIEIPQHYARTIIDEEAAQELRIKCRAHFILYGRVRVREINHEMRHFIDLEGGVTHQPIPIPLSQRLAAEFSELLPRRVSMPTENELLSFQFTSEWADIVTKYIIGIAAAYSGDLDYAEALYTDALERLKEKDHNFPIYKKISERIPIRISELCETRAVASHRAWVETHDEIHTDRLGEYLDKAHESRRESSQVLNLRAIHVFLKTRDVEEAKSLLKKSRTQDNATWHFNMAFLLAYGGDLKGAIRQYRQAIIFQSDAGTLAQIEDFICWILEIEPEKHQLHYCLGFFNWKAKGDKVQAINDFNSFLNSGTESQFASEKELTRKFVASIKKEIGEQTT